MEMEIWFDLHLSDRKLWEAALERAKESGTLRHSWLECKQVRPIATLPSKYLRKFKRHILATGIPPAYIFTHLYRLGNKDVHSSIIYNSQNTVNILKFINKELEHFYNVMLCSLKENKEALYVPMIMVINISEYLLSAYMNYLIWNNLQNAV